MARYIGKDGSVSVGANVVAEVIGFDINDERAIARAPVMGQSFIGHGIGAPAYTGVIRCLIDPADTTGQGALKGTGPLALQLQEEGVGTGLPQIDFSEVFVNSIPRTVSSEEYATIEFSFVANSALVESTQP